MTVQQHVRDLLVDGADLGRELVGMIHHGETRTNCEDKRQSQLFERNHITQRGLPLAQRFAGHLKQRRVEGSLVVRK